MPFSTKWFLEILLGFLIVPCFLCAQNTKGVSGHIRDRNGSPLELVNVFIDNGVIWAYTDKNGFYTLKNIPEGKHQLVVSTVGYQTIKKSITIQKDSPVTLNFTLEEAAYKMGEVLVQGKSKVSQIKEQSYNVQAINTKKFYNSSVDAVGILDRLSSVRVLQNGGLGSDYSFSLNGFSGNQVKFFMNGIPMDNYGSSFNLSNIPTNAIQRIEVYNGVVPVWLGNDALGGAVNIVTNQTANFLDASYTFGSFNTHKSSLNGAYTNPKTGFTVRGNLNYNYSDNDYKVKVKVKEDKLGNHRTTRTVPRFHDRYRSTRAKIETGFVNRSFADQLLIGAVVSGDDKQIQNGSTMHSVYGGLTQNTRSAIANLKYRKKDLFTKGLDLNLNASYNYNETQNVDTLQGVTYNWAGEKFMTPGDHTGELGGKTFDQSQYDNGVNTQLNMGYQLNKHHSFAFNHSFEYFGRSAFDRRDPDKIVNQFPKSLQKNILGFSYKYDFDENWSTTLFGKAYFLKAKNSKKYDFAEGSTDKLEVKNENFGYGLASSYFILPNLQAKASYEHTYRLPKPTEIFGNGLFVQSNPDLKPEQSDNINLGATYHFTFNQKHEFKVGGSFIYRNSNDLIFQVVNIASPETNFSNLAKVRTLGVEGNVNYDFANQFEIGANITYQNITDQADLVYNDYSGYQKNFNRGERLPNRPYLFGNAHAGYRFDGVIFKKAQLKINYYFHFVEAYYLSWKKLGNKESKNIIPRQNSHDLELVYSLDHGKYNIALEIRNLTDELLYDKFYLQKPGRAFYLKLRYAF